MNPQRHHIGQARLAYYYSQSETPHQTHGSLTSLMLTQTTWWLLTHVSRLAILVLLLMGLHHDQYSPKKVLITQPHHSAYASNNNPDDEVTHWLSLETSKDILATKTNVAADASLATTNTAKANHRANIVTRSKSERFMQELKVWLTNNGRMDELILLTKPLISDSTLPAIPHQTSANVSQIRNQTNYGLDHHTTKNLQSPISTYQIKPINWTNTRELPTENPIEINSIELHNEVNRPLTTLTEQVKTIPPEDTPTVNHDPITSLTGLYLNSQKTTPNGIILFPVDMTQQGYIPQVIHEMRQQLTQYGWSTLVVLLPEKATNTQAQLLNLAIEFVVTRRYSQVATISYSITAPIVSQALKGPLAPFDLSSTEITAIYIDDQPSHRTLYSSNNSNEQLLIKRIDVITPNYRGSPIMLDNRYSQKNRKIYRSSADSNTLIRKIRGWLASTVKTSAANGTLN